MEHTLNPHTNPHRGLSNCCNAATRTMPACFGDPAFTWCDHCNTECTIVWQPVFEKLGPGSYRKIVYPIKQNI